MVILVGMGISFSGDEILQGLQALGNNWPILVIGIGIGALITWIVLRVVHNATKSELSDVLQLKEEKAKEFAEKAERIAQQKTELQTQLDDLIAKIKASSSKEEALGIQIQLILLYTQFNASDLSSVNNAKDGLMIYEGIRIPDQYPDAPKTIDLIEKLMAAEKKLKSTLPPLTEWIPAKKVSVDEISAIIDRYLNEYKQNAPARKEAQDEIEEIDNLVTGFVNKHFDKDQNE